MGDQVVVVDCDDTLVMYDMSEYPGDTPLDILNPYSGMTLQVIPNEKNIKTVIKFKKLGYYVLVWSRTGKQWADAVVDHLNLREYVDQTLAKPLYYIDDKDSTEWMGDRVYRDPNSRYGS